MDNGISQLTGTTGTLHVCTSEPANFAAIAAITKGNKANITVGSPEAGTGLGRKVVISAITDGTITGVGTVTHWAYELGSVLLAAGTLSASAAVSSGTFTLTAIDVSINAPT